MRKNLLLFFFLLSAHCAQAGGRNESSLRSAAKNLDRALEKKDTIFLNKYLSDQLQYGHSNGWIESKEALKTHLFNGKLVYQSITLNGKEPAVVIEKKTGLVREEVTIDVLLDGKPLNMKLSVLQVWIFRKGEWRLIGRQSTKV